MQLRSATAYDLDLLAGMNHRLIEDEKSSNPMDLEQLRERMRGWLESNYHAVLLEDTHEVIGYALYRVEDETLGERCVVYLRQFFIKKVYRRKGLGRKAFAELRRTYFVDALVRLEVLTTNPDGLAFWKSLGFEPYAVTMGLK